MTTPPTYRGWYHRRWERAMDDQTRFLVLGLYAKGEKTEYIAHRARCSTAAVSKIAHRHGMRRRRVKGTLFETIYD